MTRVGTRLLGSIPLLLSSMLGGCYAHHTADEELLDIGFPDEVYPDAGVVADGGAGNKCAQTDPIQRLLCQFTQGAGNGTGTGTGTGAGGIQDIIDQFTGGGTGTGTGTGAGGIQDIIDLLGGLNGGGQGTGTGAGGLQDIIDLFGGLNGGGTGTGTGTGGLGGLQDLIDQLNAGRRDAGAPTQPGTGTGTQVTEATCAKATDVQTRILCALNGFPTPSQGRRDGGTGFAWPFPLPGQATTDAGVAPTLY